MNRKTKFKIIWATYVILISPFVLVTMVSHLFDTFVSFSASYIEELKNLIIIKYKPRE